MLPVTALTFLIKPTKQKKSNLLSSVDPISNHIDYGILQGYFLSEPIVVFVRSSKYTAKSLSVTIFDRLILFVDSDLAKWFGDLTKTIISSDKNPAFNIKYTTVRSKWSAHNRKGRFFSLFMVRGYHFSLQLSARK